MSYNPKKYAAKRKSNTLTPWEKFVHRTQQLPAALTGLALGLCGIGACIDANIGTFDHAWRWWISCGCIGLAVILLTLATIRNAVHPKILKFEITEPMISSFLPTFAMALMCIAGFIAGWQHGQKGIPPCQVIGAVIIVFAVTIHLILCTIFTRAVLFKHKWNESEMYGTWFVPSVGLATAATLSTRFNQNILPNEFFQAIWWFAFLWYLGLFFEVTYSLLFKKQLVKERFASSAVYFAPAGLTATSFLVTFALPFSHAIATATGSSITFLPGTHYINVYPETFINVMLVILVAMSFTYSLLLIFVFGVRILKQQFSYLFASLTFPLAINSDAMAFTGTYLFNLGKDYHLEHLLFLKDMAWTFRIIGYIFVIISASIIAYIAIRFLIKVVRDLSSDAKDHDFHNVYKAEMDQLPL